MGIFIQGVLFFNTEKKAVRNSSKKWLMSAICQVLSWILFPSDKKKMTSLHLASSHLLLGECQAQWKKKSHTQLKP